MMHAVSDARARSGASHMLCAVVEWWWRCGAVAVIRITRALAFFGEVMRVFVGCVNAFISLNVFRVVHPRAREAFK